MGAATSITGITVLSAVGTPPVGTVDGFGGCVVSDDA